MPYSDYTRRLAVARRWRAANPEAMRALNIRHNRLRVQPDNRRRYHVTADGLTVGGYVTRGDAAKAVAQLRAADPLPVYAIQPLKPETYKS